MFEMNEYEYIKSNHIEKVFGKGQSQSTMSTRDILTRAEERYHVFHLIIQEGSNYRRFPDYVDSCWHALLNQRVIKVPDYTQVPAFIVSTLELFSGKPKEEVVDSWDTSTALGLRENMPSSLSNSLGTGVWRPQKRHLVPT